MEETMPRFLAPLLAIVVLLTACQPAPTGDSLTETPATVTPTETPIPLTPTETPDPLSTIDLQNPATYPEWMSYFTRGEFPSVEAQKAMSADMFQLYRNLLTDRGVEDVEGMLDSQVFFMAGQIANQEGWNLPANLDATRAWFAGPQANTYGTELYGIFASDSYGSLINLAYMPGEIYVDVFGENTQLQRQQGYGAVNAPEGILVDLTEGKKVIILHYTNGGNDYYFPLSVLFNETTSSGKIGFQGNPPYRFLTDTFLVPPTRGYERNISLFWPTEQDLRNALTNCSSISITSYNGPQRQTSPIIYGLEFASIISISP
jgi:hypothetical protein